MKRSMSVCTRGAFATVLGLGLVFSLLVFAPKVKAQASHTYSSGSITSSSVVSKYPCLLTDLAVYADGTNGATVVLYDNASAASGTIIGKVIVPALSKSGGLVIPIPVKASNGVYISITGTNASAIVFTTPE